MIAVLKKAKRELAIYQGNYATFKRRALEWKEQWPKEALASAIEAEECRATMLFLDTVVTNLYLAIRFKHRNEPGFNIEGELLK